MKRLVLLVYSARSARVLFVNMDNKSYICCRNDNMMLVYQPRTGEVAMAGLPALTSFLAALVLPRYMIKLMMLYKVESVLVFSTN
jgi:hypothetical protein